MNRIPYPVRHSDPSAQFVRRTFRKRAVKWSRIAPASALAIPLTVWLDLHPGWIFAASLWTFTACGVALFNLYRSR